MVLKDERKDERLLTEGIHCIEKEAFELVTY